MDFDAWITLTVVVLLVGLFIAERIPPAFAVAGSVLLLLVLGIIDESEALSGFSNPAPVTVAALYVIAGAVEATGALDRLADHILGRKPPSSRPRPTRGDIARLAFPVAIFSAFFPNTPLVAMAAPRVQSWARRAGRASSDYLMPLSFSAILGGIITTVGTSTNLVVSGLLEASGHPPLGLFEITPLGVVMAALGLATLVALYPLLMPERTAAHDRFSASAREFTVEMSVDDGGPLEGLTVAAAELRNLQGVYLVEIERSQQILSPVPPDTVLKGRDRLVFAGNVSKVLDLMRMRGLSPVEERHFTINGPRAARFFEVVIGSTSHLIGATVKQVHFRSRYGAAALALHRAGEPVRQKLGEVPLRAGDVLLVIGDPDFRRRWAEAGDFVAVSPVEGTGPVRKHKSIVVRLTVAAMVSAAGLGLVSLLQASLLAVAALLVLRVITPAEAHRAVDVHVILLIAASFGLGHAITNSGLAQAVAGFLTGFGSADLLLLAGVLLSTIVLTSMISNNAAAVLMFPIALAVSSQAGLNPRSFAVAVMVGASMDFLTPIGYQTNTMVYGMGGYRFLDFSRLGAPLTAVVVAIALIAIPLLWPLR
ncbi:MAG: SLC13 family permease [Actinomycetota bacterium]